MTKILQINRSFQWNQELPADPVNNEPKRVKRNLLLYKKKIQLRVFNSIETYNWVCCMASKMLKKWKKSLKSKILKLGH